MKYSHLPKLSKNEQEELLSELCEAIAAIKKPQEAAYFLKDLLGEQEVGMLAKRLKIARLLLQGKTYDEIVKNWKASKTTIARINLWLNYSGGIGYRLIAKRVKEKKKEFREPDAWNAYKKKYSQYFLLDRILETINKNIKKKKQKEIEEFFNGLKSKKQFLRAINQVLSEPYQELARKKKLSRFQFSHQEPPK